LCRLPLWDVDRMERDTAIPVQRAAIGALQARLAPSSARRAVQATYPSPIVPCALDGAPYPRTPRAAPRTASPHPCSAVSAHAGPSAHAVPAVARTRATGRYGATAARITARGNSGAPLSLATGRAARCNASSAHAGPCEGIGVSETRTRARDAVAARAGRIANRPARIAGNGLKWTFPRRNTNTRSPWTRTSVRLSAQGEVFPFSLSTCHLNFLAVLLVPNPPEFLGLTCAHERDMFPLDSHPTRGGTEMRFKVVRSDCGTGWLVVNASSERAVSSVFRRKEHAMNELTHLTRPRPDYDPHIDQPERYRDGFAI